MKQILTFKTKDNEQVKIEIETIQSSNEIIIRGIGKLIEKQDLEHKIKAIETAAQKVLDARLEFPKSSLADLYDPLTMPPNLLKAHNDLDKAVDLAYRPQPFTGEAKRMEFLFELYEKYTADLFTKVKVKKGKI